MEHRKTTSEDYQQRVETVVRYIDEHLNEDFRLDRLADVACFSRWHFQHIMHAFLGEPVWAYVMRRRTETAAQLLRQTQRPVGEIATEVGYDAPSSLTKAFRLFYNVSPMEYRNNLNINIMDTVKVKVNENLTLKASRIVTIEPRQVIYLELTGAYTSLDFDGAYKRLWRFVKENKLFSAGIEHLAFYFDDPKVTEPAELRTHVCLVVRKPAVPKDDIQVKTIEGGKYAKFLYQGPYSNLSAVYDAIFSQWCPCSPDCECYATHESGKCECGCLRDAPCFEKYVNRPDPAAPEKAKTEIYIPIV